MRLLIGALGMIALLSPARASAQCDCDHTIALDVTGFDGAAEGVMPGDRICVMAGARSFLRFQNIAGTAEAPVTILNCGGRVTISNDDRAYALVFEDDSHHFRITGTGDDAHTYGFDISAPDREPYPGVGLWLLGRSSDYEADHLEIHHTGFAGVMAKTDPLCDGSADQGVFVQRNSRLHHLWVHDTGGEGFYVGSTQSEGHTITCDGTSEVHQPHWLEGVEIHDNLVEDTGWDGMQVGMARQGCRVYRNVIRRVGLEGVEFQQQGLQIGTYSRCEVFGNVISDGPAMGIIVLGADETFIHDNLIVGFTAADGIYAHHRDVIPGARYRFDQNTIVGWMRNGITVFGGQLGPSEALGNLMVGAGPGVAAGGDVDWTEASNVVVATAAEAGFVSDGDYHITDTSIARGAGTVIEDALYDLEGYPRASPPSAGAYEHRDPTIDAGPLVRDAGTPTREDAGISSRTDGGPGSTPSGCGCRASGASGAPSFTFVALLSLALVRRRR